LDTESRNAGSDLACGIQSGEYLVVSTRVPRTTPLLGNGDGKATLQLAVLTPGLIIPIIPIHTLYIYARDCVVANETHFFLHDATSPQMPARALPILS
jgi:hypothetical protein